MYKLEVNLNHPSLNSWLAGASHWKRSTIKRESEEALMWQLRASSIPKPLTTPFTLSVTVFRPRPYDTDNIIISAKFFLDALKNSGYIPDDTVEYCPTIILSSKKSKKKEYKIIYLIQPLS